MGERAFLLPLFINKLVKGVVIRILWSSNTPTAMTGYGCQTALNSQVLMAMGHEVGILAFWGLKGSMLHWGNIPVFPNDCEDWGIQNAPAYYQYFQADALITLVDAWVLGDIEPALNWFPWTPIDHDPPPPAVVEVLKKHEGLIKPIAMTKWGQSKLADQGIDSYYVPHTIDCNIFSPRSDYRKLAHDAWDWHDKFVVGTVGTNHAERKNWQVSMKAMRLFEQNHPGEIIWYLHTNPFDPRGVNLGMMREMLGINHFTYFPHKTEMMVGISDDTMARMYNSLDAFLLPSKGEGFGIPYVEAQACGVPVIMTKCTSQQDLMGGGWFIEDLEPEWTLQNSWQFDCKVGEVLQRLEDAYNAKQDGSIKEISKAAREKALEYSIELAPSYWKPVLEDMEVRISERNASKETTEESTDKQAAAV